MLQKIKLGLNLCVVVILLVLAVTPAFAKQGAYSLGLRRVIGYNSGDQIRGTMSMFVNGPANIQSVKFMIDGKVISEVSQAPFSVTFVTTEYDSGWHDLSAVIQTTDDQTFNTAIRKEFASPEQERSNLFNIIGPILGILVLVVLLGAGSQILFFRNKFKSMPPGTARNYGLHGGTICPRCSRPYALHWWSPNLFTRRFDRCDFCGKWAVVHSLSTDVLRAAEQKELESFGTPSPIAEKSEEEKLKEMLDKSKYSDH